MLKSKYAKTENAPKNQVGFCLKIYSSVNSFAVKISAIMTI
jgi:hypothetical protein